MVKDTREYMKDYWISFHFYISFFIYLNCGERYEEVIDHCSYRHNLSSCEINCFRMNFTTILFVQLPWPVISSHLSLQFKYMFFHLITWISCVLSFDCHSCNYIFVLPLSHFRCFFMSKIYIPVFSQLEGGNSLN